MFQISIIAQSILIVQASRSKRLIQETWVQTLQVRHFGCTKASKITIEFIFVCLTNSQYVDSKLMWSDSLLKRFRYWNMYKNKENSIKIPIFVKTKSTIIKKIVHFRAITTTELKINYSFKNMVPRCERIKVGNFCQEMPKRSKIW